MWKHFQQGEGASNIVKTTAKFRWKLYLGDAAHEPDHGVPVAGEPLHAAPGAVHQTRGHLGKGEKFLYSQL